MAASFDNNSLLQVLDITIKHVNMPSTRSDGGGVASGNNSPIRGPAYAFETDPITHNMQRMALGVDVNECCLPPGWTARFSPTKQRVCFIHEASGAMQFTHPGM
ncbi:hypothetical protein H310_12229 [Aphanomyces invadans]|uniref:WW domain-containing protein n=1 Tax=Aphanomyces invadans TaxID=157072 RepID=A0A024TIS9_9STRA|nr:hypothetical protein H310_12229 [Aphanomyces invadans]ETV93884.1 hypothetical protein H310_12229 [Aphanomyces invadans]|eukprot:XP_008877444.1 hypothetical protein H310_12229 [Aphanomyces invadans]